jgi:LmbE family N-acetylglucosaminyl deacetylase
VRIVHFSLCEHLGAESSKLIREADDSATTLGITAQHDLKFHPFRARHFHADRQLVLDALIGYRDAFEPELVLFPSARDDHQDHTVIAEEATRAFKHVTCLGYEAPWNNRGVSTDLFVRLERRHVQKKADALACYQTQKHRRYMDPEFTWALARVRGVQAGGGFAEAFEVVRAFS